ncbi:MAG: hypothetical protein Q4B01_08300 [Eubacteriales bacterium]|nr:hypothetical protein [Eubacteriales bacterium]
MKKKRIFAWICIIFLVALYIADLVFALMNSDYAADLLKISLYATVVIPVLMYAVLTISRVLGYSEKDSEDPSDRSKKN